MPQQKSKTVCLCTLTLTERDGKTEQRHTCWLAPEHSDQHECACGYQWSIGATHAHYPDTVPK